MNKYIQYFAIILLLGTMWWAFLFARTFLEESDNNNLNFVPKNADLVASFSGKLLFEEALVSVVFQRHDKEIFGLIEEYRKKDGEQSYRLIGIDYLSQVIVFSMTVEKRTIVGMLFNLNDPEEFETNFRPLLSKNQVLHATNDVGLIMTQYPLKNTRPLSKSKFNELAEELLDAPGQPAVNDFLIETESLLKIRLKGNKELLNAGIRNMLLSTSIKGKSIDLEGILQMKEPNDLNASKMTALKPSGLHLSSRIIPDRTNDFVRSFFGDSIPELYGFSINYFTSEIVKDSEHTLLPYADVLLQFKDKVDLHSMLRSNSDIVKSGQGSFRYKDFELNCRQLNDSTIFIGKSDFTKDSYVTISELALLCGDLNRLTKLEGNELLLKVMRMTRLFASFEEFLNGIENCRISVNPANDGQSKVAGKIEFKDDKSALNALLKLGVRGQFFD